LSFFNKYSLCRFSYIELSLNDDAKLYVLQHKNRMFRVKYLHRTKTLTVDLIFSSTQTIDTKPIKSIFITYINLSNNCFQKHVLQHIFKLKLFFALV